jgi:hypothetical protein
MKKINPPAGEKSGDKWGNPSGEPVVARIEKVSLHISTFPSAEVPIREEQAQLCPAVQVEFGQDFAQV